MSDLITNREAKNLTYVIQIKDPVPPGGTVTETFKPGIFKLWSVSVHEAVAQHFTVGLAFRKLTSPIRPRDVPDIEYLAVPATEYEKRPLVLTPKGQKNGVVMDFQSGDIDQEIILTVTSTSDQPRPFVVSLSGHGVVAS